MGIRELVAPIALSFVLGITACITGQSCYNEIQRQKSVPKEIITKYQGQLQ